MVNMMIPNIDQLIMLFGWLFLIFLFQLSMWPFLRSLSETYALPLSFPVSLLLMTLLSWYLAYLHLPVHLVLVPVVLLIGYALGKRVIVWGDIRGGYTWYLMFFGVFVLALLVKLWFNPAIDISYEKVMDSMILSSMMYNPTIPPMDAWFAGETLSWYYYLGAWMFAVPGIILSIPASVVYNLVIPTVFAVSAVMIYSSSTLLLKRFRFLPLLLLVISYPGFFNLIPVVLSENVPFRFILDGTTRLLPGAVTENPLSALLIGSPRPYAIALMIQCVIIFLVIFTSYKWQDIDTKARSGIAIILGLSLGTLIPLHTWDILIYLPLVIAVGLLVSFRIFQTGDFLKDSNVSSLYPVCVAWLSGLHAFLSHPRSLYQNGPASSVLFLGIIAPVLAILFYIPFFFDLENKRMQGISLSLVASEPVSFILVHGFFLLILLVYLRRDIFQRPLFLIFPLLIAVSGFISAALIFLPVIYLLIRRFSRIEEVLALFGLMCILFCEGFAMVQNGMPDRANTTYKFYFAAWILLGVSTFSLLGEMLGTCHYITSERRYTLVSIILIVAALTFPGILLSSGPIWSPNLDGTAFVSEYVGDEEAHALKFLKALKPGEILIEGVVPMDFDQDEPAKYFSRISSYTGIPSVMGSFTRENVYRGNEVTRERGEDSVRVYIQPDVAAEIMAKYNATLLYVGTPEIMIYQMQDPGVYAQYGFTPVYHENSTVIWRPPYRQT